MFDHSTEKRTFEWEHEGRKGWMGLPVYARLSTWDGSLKEVWQFEEGEKGRGNVELFSTGELVEVWFTCVEP